MNTHPTPSRQPSPHRFRARLAAFAAVALGGCLAPAFAQTYVSIDYPGAVWTDANRINAQGVIVGEWGGADGGDHAYVRTPGRHERVED